VIDGAHPCSFNRTRITSGVERLRVCDTDGALDGNCRYVREVDNVVKGQVAHSGVSGGARNAITFEVELNCTIAVGGALCDRNVNNLAADKPIAL
jgi:hypothetical protein